MTRKPASVWDDLDFVMSAILGVCALVAVMLFNPVGGFLGTIMLPGVALIVVWGAGYWKGVRLALLTLLLIGVGMFGWAVTRPFYGDTLFYGDVIFEGDRFTVSATGTKWQAPVMPTPTKRVRDWFGPDQCTERNRFFCGLTHDTVIESDEGWRFKIAHDGVLTWPEGVTDAQAARFFCDLPAEDFTDLDRVLPYLIAFQAARPTLAPALEAECGL